MPNVVNSDQYLLVQDLLERQDEALEQLEALNIRVEKAIEEVNAFRNIDNEDADAAEQIQFDSDADSTESVDEQQQSKAA